VVHYEIPRRPLRMARIVQQKISNNRASHPRREELITKMLQNNFQLFTYTPPLYDFWQVALLIEFDDYYFDCYLAKSQK
jgi:hypothetical protein